MTSAPHSTNILAVLRPIPTDKQPRFRHIVPVFFGLTDTFKSTVFRSNATFCADLRDVRKIIVMNASVLYRRALLHANHENAIFRCDRRGKILPFPAPVTKARFPLKLMSMMPD